MYYRHDDGRHYRHDVCLLARKPKLSGLAEMGKTDPRHVSQIALCLAAPNSDWGRKAASV